MYVIKPCRLYERLITLTAAAVMFFLPLTGGLAFAGTYRLTITENTVALTGKQQRAVAVNGSLPGPILHWQEGEDVALHVTNALKEPTSVHWHGIILPYDMDGVPGISFSGIAPGETFSYRFHVKQSGTYWYHGHSGMQEQLGLFGALIIDPPHEHYPAERDYVILLSDWPEADPERTLARLKKQSDYYNFQKRTVGDFFREIGQNGWSATIADRLAWGEMRMDPTDLADVTGATYHFLINGQTPTQNWTALFKPGETVRLRFINAAAMTYFDIRIPGLKMRLIAADGQNVRPVDIDEFRIAVAETYDVLVKPQAGRAYSIFAEAMDRSGYARATLTPRSGLQAPLPGMRPRTLLTLADMGGTHGGHAHPSSGAAADAAGRPTNHSGHTPAAVTTDASTTKKEHDAMNHEHLPSGHAFSHHATTAHEPPATTEHHHPEHSSPLPKHPGATAESPKVLSYQDLQAANPAPEWGPPAREITLRLTGNMNRYIWSFDDVKYSASEPIRLRFGEHVRFRYVNETMMNHPIHLHGLWQYVDNGKGAHNPKKHVVNVKPGATVSVDVLADALEDWAFHCHLLYHMDTGMFRKLTVEAAELPREH